MTLCCPDCAPSYSVMLVFSTVPTLLLPRCKPRLCEPSLARSSSSSVQQSCLLAICYSIQAESIGSRILSLAEVQLDMLLLPDAPPESPFLAVVQMDSFGGMRLGAGSMPMGAPSGRGAPFYGGGGGGQVPMPETPLLDSSRKRMREHYYPASEHSMPQHVSTSRQRSC